MSDAPLGNEYSVEATTNSRGEVLIVAPDFANEHVRVTLTRTRSKPKVKETWAEFVKRAYGLFPDLEAPPRTKDFEREDPLG